MELFDTSQMTDPVAAAIAGDGPVDETLAAAGFDLLVGVDEAGRGTLCGPLVAAACVAGQLPAGVADSKTLTAQRRDELDSRIRDTAVTHVVEVPAAQVDRVGVQAANVGALRDAAAGAVLAHAAASGTPVKLLAERMLVVFDGFDADPVQVTCPHTGDTVVVRHVRLVRGDARSATVGAASIVAKAAHGRRMRTLDAAFPGYGLAEHQGYGTREHLAALRGAGPCPEHRRSFAPLSRQSEPQLT